MARYGQAFKDRAMARLLAPESAAAEVVAREVGIGADARLDAVITTAAMNEQPRAPGVASTACTRPSWTNGESVARLRWPNPRTHAPAHRPRAPTANASRNSGATCCARTAHWPRRQRCWCSQKTYKRIRDLSGLAAVLQADSQPSNPAIVSVARQGIASRLVPEMARWAFSGTHRRSRPANASTAQTARHRPRRRPSVFPGCC